MGITQTRTNMSTSSMRDALLDPLLRINNFSETLLKSLGPVSSAYKLPPPPPLSELIECDYQLATALQEARVHQGKQKEIEELTAEILELDAQLREVITALSRGKEALENILTEGEEVLAAAEQASKGNASNIRMLAVSNNDLPGAVPYKTILSYASNLAKFTSAPPSLEPLRPESMFNGPINPPFPSVEMMRRGKMNFEAPLGSLGEIREVGRRKSDALDAYRSELTHSPLFFSVVSKSCPSEYGRARAVRSRWSDAVFDICSIAAARVRNQP